MFGGPLNATRLSCSYEKPEAIPGIVSELFGLHATLYEHGARNFILVDLPPVERSPSGRPISRYIDAPVDIAACSSQDPAQRMHNACSLITLHGPLCGTSL